MITCENANFIQLSGFSKLTKTIKMNVYLLLNIWQKIRLAKEFVKACGEQCNKRVICLHILYCKGPSGDSFLAPSLFMSFMSLGWHISVNASSQWGRIHTVILIATRVYDFTMISYSI